MRKKLAYFFLIIFFPIFIYTLGWFISLLFLSHAINKQFANLDINTKAIGTGEEFYVRFSNVALYGFPFKIAIKINNYQEESSSSKIGCKSPIYLGYDLIRQGFFGNYSGEILANYKPIQAGFGSKILSDNYLFFIKLPLKYKLLKNIFSDEKNWFEIINFVKFIELKSNKIEIYDLVDNSKLYDQDYKITNITFKKRKYYNTLVDLLNNIPSRLEIFQKNKINYAVWDRKISPASLLFGIHWPIFLNGENRLYINFHNPIFENLSNDLEIGFNSNSTSNIHSGQVNALYRGKLHKLDADVSLKLFANLSLNKGFFDAIFNFLKYLNNYSERTLANEKPNILKNGSNGDVVKLFLDNLQSKINNSNLKKLEAKNYEIDANINLINLNNSLKFKFYNLSIFSGQTGFRLNTEGRFDKSLQYFTKGLVSFDNYNKIIDHFISDDMFSATQNYSQESRSLYSETLKYFLKNISDHPKSLSNNISLAFEVDSTDMDKGKVGLAEIKNLKKLFNLALYKKAIERMKTGENAKEKIKELLPNLNEDQQKALEQIISNPTQVYNDIWQKLIK